MSRRETLLAGLALILMALGAAWFFAHYTREPVTRWQEPGPEAARNAYLALERFTERMGRPLARIEQAQDLERLEPGGVLLLESVGRSQLTPERAEWVLAWVAQGGYLIVAADTEGGDSPLLAKLGVRWQEQEAVPPEDDALAEAPETGKPAEEAEPAQAETEPAEEDEDIDVFPVTLPGEHDALKVDLLPHWHSRRLLKPSTPSPAWQAGPAEGAALLHYPHGRGHITVLSSFIALENDHIGQYDHAELLWRLLRRYGPQGAARLAVWPDDPRRPSVWNWLAESAWMALASGGALILAWLWATVPRFGGTVQEAEPARRGLAEHLAAMGWAVWREGGLKPWAELLRQDLKDHIARTHPQFVDLPEAEQLDRLARAGQLPPEQLAALLDPAAEHDPEAFVRLARAVQQMERTL